MVNFSAMEFNLLVAVDHVYMSSDGERSLFYSVHWFLGCG